MAGSLSPCVSASRCVDRACSPPIGNLASGRSLFTLSGCCGNSSSHLCPYPPAPPRLCPEDAHPPSHMADDPFLHPDTWWASGVGAGAPDEVRLDLETRFYLSHVILVFRSPRPAAMAIERSADFGRTWETLGLFARNCSAEFGVDDDAGSPCTSRYTSAAPCTKGEVRKQGLGFEEMVLQARFLFPPQVILRLLDPSTSAALDPYGPEAAARLTLTNLRVRLLRAQTCPAPAGTGSAASALTSAPAAPAPDAAPYALYTLLARGTCLCHGHAERCAPHHNGSLDAGLDQNTVGVSSSSSEFVRVGFYLGFPDPGPDVKTGKSQLKKNKPKPFLTLYDTCQDLF